jgi:ribosomal protein S18 acetylase RimI-like enzyme
MRFALGDLAFRVPTADELPRAHELIVRCEVQDYGELDTDLDDLRFDWDRIDLARDAWLVATPTGDLVGYGAVICWRKELEYVVVVDPSWAGRGLDQSILARCEARGRGVAQARGEKMVAKCYVSHASQRMHEVLRTAGFRLVKYHFQMRVRLNDPPPAPIWPAGVTVRSAVPEQDGRAIHQLIERAFARPGRTATTFEEWQDFMMRGNILDSDLWFLAIAGERIVGACLCFAYPTEGWVRQLAVVESWRRKGIGTALLRHAFGVFHKRGYDRAGLAVESENPGAYAFYQHVGMQPVRQHDEYVRAIGRHQGLVESQSPRI